jgi:hypothetical protein
MHLHQNISCAILFAMRTTLDIDDDILAAARDLAKAEGKTMGEIISDLARRGLTAPSYAVSGMSESAATFQFGDWPTLPGREGLLVTPEMIERIQEELDLEDATAWDHTTDQPRKD